MAFDSVLVSPILVSAQTNRSRRISFICGKTISSEECCVFTLSPFRVGGKEIVHQNRLKNYGVSAGPRARQYRHLACSREHRCLSAGELEWQLLPHHQAFPCILGIQTLILLLWWWVIYHQAISPATLSVDASLMLLLRRWLTNMLTPQLAWEKSIFSLNYL